MTRRPFDLPTETDPDSAAGAALDSRIRQALEPSPETVARVVQSAHAAAPNRRSAPWAAVLAAGLLVALFLGWPDPTRRIPEPAETAAALTLSNEQGVVRVTAADGTTLLVVPTPNS